MLHKQKIYNGVKILLVIIDGLGDSPVKELGNKTPLESAETPNLNFLAKNGICGQVLPFLFPWQKFPPSDTTHLALLGYNPKKYYLGRGVYEVAGIGMKMKKGDVALRVNFGTVDKNLKIIDRRAGRIEKTDSLVKALEGLKIEGVKFLVKKSYGHRLGLILRPSKSNLKKLSPQISEGDPHLINEKVREIKALDNSKEAKFTAKILNQFLDKTHQILENHKLNINRKRLGLLPANYLLIRGAGIFKKNPSFKEKHNLKSVFIAGGALYKGIGRILGMKEIKVEKANGFVNTNLKGKILAAKNALKRYGFVFLHVKAADSLAEDGNFFGKKEFIEKIDKNLKPILKLKNTLVVITADHSTSSRLKNHFSGPIPILIYGNGKDGVEKFSEKNCQKGELGKFSQLELMPKILKYAEIK